MYDSNGDRDISQHFWDYINQKLSEVKKDIREKCQNQAWSERTLLSSIHLNTLKAESRNAKSPMTI